jgi:hypothetical protein
LGYADAGQNHDRWFGALFGRAEPDLIEHYFYILLEILHTAKQDGEDYNRSVKILPGVSVLEPVELMCIAKDDELPEWVKQDVEPCVEEEETPDPCSFIGPLKYLSLEKYESLLESHISEDLLKHIPEIKKYLLSEKCKAVFVPEVWQGIKGIDNLKLQTKDSLPSSINPPARPVNKRVFEPAQKEFERMLTYFYTKNESPWASPLVIAPKTTKPFIRICGDYVTVNNYIVRSHYTIPNVLHELQKCSEFRLFVIHDNLLVCAHDYDDAHDYRKLQLMIDRAYKRNVVLKMTKSWLGVKKVRFFGYDVTHGKFE